MTDTALAVRPDDVALEAYGDLAEVRELTKRLMAMLPSAKDLGPGGAGALAQASLAMGLNPFIGQIWAIPQGGKNSSGTYDTYGIMVGISGLRAKAHEQAKADHGMYTVYYRLPRAEEIEGLTLNPGDIARACDLTLSTDSARRHFEFTGEVPRYTGIGVFRKGERTKMNPLQNARKRSEAEAIKQAFDVPLSFEYGAAPASGDVEIDAMPERYEEQGGELVNGSAKQATDELFGDYVDADPYEDEVPTGDSLLNGDFHGAPKDAEAKEDYREVQEDAAVEGLPADTDLDYTPEWIDTDTPRLWGKLYFEARKLGYANDSHVKGALAQVYGIDKWNENEQSEQNRSYRESWHLLQEHQRSKVAETA